MKSFLLQKIFFGPGKVFLEKIFCAIVSGVERTESQKLQAPWTSLTKTENGNIGRAGSGVALLRWRNSRE
jgi:hypothetical protein